MMQMKKKTMHISILPELKKTQVFLWLIFAPLVHLRHDLLVTKLKLFSRAFVWAQSHICSFIRLEVILKRRCRGPNLKMQSEEKKRLFWGEGDGVIAPPWGIRHCLTHAVCFHSFCIWVPQCLWWKMKHRIWLITIKPLKSSWTLNWKSKAKISKVYVTFAWRFLRISLILKTKTLGYDPWKLK